MKRMMYRSSPPSEYAIPMRPDQIAIIATPNMMISAKRSRESPLVSPGARTMMGSNGISSSSLAKMASLAIDTVCLTFLFGAGI